MEKTIPQQPENTTILITNVPNESETWISLPMSGNLWVANEYGYGGPSKVYIWHQGGQTEEVPLGFNTFYVNATDALVYESNPQKALKLGWAYV